MDEDAPRADGAPSGESASPPPPLPATPAQPAPQVVYQTVVQAPTNGMATASLVLGILGVVFFWTVWLGLILGALGIIFGALGRGKAKQGAPNQGLATAGLTLGIIAVVGSVLFFLLIVSAVNNSEDLLNQISYCIDHPNAAGC